jgi:hypothetical protein
VLVSAKVRPMAKIMKLARIMMNSELSSNEIENYYKGMFSLKCDNE